MSDEQSRWMERTDTLGSDNDGLRISLTKSPGGVPYANGEIFLPFSHSFLMRPSIHHSDESHSLSFSNIQGKLQRHYSYQMRDGDADFFPDYVLTLNQQQCE